MTILLWPMPRTDLGTLAALHAACFPEDPWDSDALSTVLAMPGTEGRVAGSETGVPLGLLIDQCVDGDAEVLTLGVLLSSRRHGIARALLRDLFSRARAKGATRIVLEVAADNDAARALYRSEGFVHQGIRRGYYRRTPGPNIDAWRLSREIATPRSF